MNFELSHEQRLIVDTARAFVEKELYPWALEKIETANTEQVHEF